MAPKFNPANTLILNGWELDGPGVRAAILDGYHRIKGEELSPIFQGTPLEEIDGLGVDQGDIPTNIGLGPATLTTRLRGDKGTMRYLASFVGGSAAVVTPPSATLARVHTWSRNETDILFDNTLTVQIARDNGSVWSLQGCQVQQLVMAMEGGNLVDMAPTLMWRDQTRFAEPVVVSDITPNTKQAVLSGFLNRANFKLGVAAEANSVHIQVADITNLPTSVDVLAKVGAGAFGVIPFTLPIGLRPDGEPFKVQVLDSTTGRPLGTTAVPVLLHSADGTGYEIAVTPDEWTYGQLVEWIPVLEDKPFFNLTRAVIQVDGSQEVLNSSTVTLTQGLRLPGDGAHIGPAIPLPLSAQGDERHEITFAKDQIDLSIEDKIIYPDTEFQIIYDLKTDVFIDAGFPFQHEIQLTFDGCHATAGQGHKTSTDKEAREDTITVIASGAPPLEVEITTTILDFAV